MLFPFLLFKIGDQRELIMVAQLSYRLESAMMAVRL